MIHTHQRDELTIFGKVIADRVIEGQGAATIRQARILTCYDPR
jgi:hypothetical protein